MKESPTEIQINQQVTKVSAWITSPFLWGFIILYLVSFFLLPDVSAEWLPRLALLGGTVLVSLLVIILTPNKMPATCEIPRPALEGYIVLGWYIAFVAISMATRANDVLGNEFAKWIWFVILPVLLIWFFSRNERNFKGTFRSVGLHRQGIGRALLLGLLVFAILTPVIVFSMSTAQFDKLKDILQNPLKLLITFPIGFLLMLVTAGFTEEVFFRGIMQSRLSRLMRSEINGCLLVAFLFGIYHLPYAFFSTSWDTHGDLIWSVASVLTEQMPAGLVLGVLWMRTHNLMASIFCHSLINTLAIISSNFVIKFGN